MEWTFQQMCGLVTAVDKLHTGDISLDNGVKRYCRHGDIRPANILWFESDTDSNGILVLADMGVAAFNRTYSRSKQPGRYVAQISGYHPPEMVMADGVVNPTFDIWSLGCVFLDMIAWALGGNTWLHAFNEARVDEPSILVRSDVFYRIVKDEGEGDKYDAILKGSVNEWIGKMYDHRNCTPTLKNVLKTIQKKMVVVARNKRARANDLVSIFDNLSNDPSITMSTANEADSMEEIEIAPALLHSLRTEGYNKTDDHPIKSMKTITDEETHREIPLSPADSRHHHPVDPETETHGQEDTSSERSVTSEIPVPRPPQGIQRQLWFFDSFTYRPHDFPTLVDDIIYLLPFRRRLIFWLAPPVSTGKKRVWWRCTCGEPLYDDIPIAVQTLQRQLEDNAQTRTGEEQRNPDREQVRPLMQWLPSWNGILNPIETIATALRNVFESTGTDNVLPVHNTNVSTVSNPQDDREQDNLHLLLCIDKSRMTSVKQECLGTIGDDKELFTFLRGQYESFDMDANMVPDVYACPRDGSHNATCICLPPVKRIESGEYRCSPQPKQEPEEGKHPAVKPSHLKHYFDGRHPMKVIDRRCLDQIPKRVKGRLAVLPGVYAPQCLPYVVALPSAAYFRATLGHEIILPFICVFGDRPLQNLPDAVRGCFMIDDIARRQAYVLAIVQVSDCTRNATNGKYYSQAYVRFLLGQVVVQRLEPPDSPRVRAEAHKLDGSLGSPTPWSFI
ncbi:kinase-like domain-containing protein [Apiospora arundinis]